MWVALKDHSSIPTSLVIFNFSWSLREICYRQANLFTALQTCLLPLHIYIWCFLQQEYIHPQLLCINSVHYSHSVLFDVFPNPYHNWCLLPSISPVTSQAELFISISGTMAYCLILSQGFYLPMCQSVCLKRCNCGRDWPAVHHSCLFLCFLGLQLYHIFQASLQSDLAIWLSCSQSNLNGSDVCHFGITHKKPHVLCSLSTSPNLGYTIISILKDKN